jgi:hypothetical protein
VARSDIYATDTTLKCGNLLNEVATRKRWYLLNHMPQKCATSKAFMYQMKIACVTHVVRYAQSVHDFWAMYNVAYAEYGLHAHSD